MACNAPKCREARKLAEQRAAEEAQRKVAARSCTEITEEFLTNMKKKHRPVCSKQITVLHDQLLKTIDFLNQLKSGFKFF